MTGLWDGYMALIGNEIVEKYNDNCGESVFITVSDLVEVVDALYREETNRSFSPANLLKDIGLNKLCTK